MCKGTKTSEKSLLELPPSSIGLETVSCLLVLAYNNRLPSLSPCFSLIGRCCGLPVQSLSTEVLWIKYSCALVWTPPPHPWNSWARLRQQPQASRSSWVYPCVSYNGLSLSVYAMVYARMWKRGGSHWPAQQLVLPKFRNPLSGTKSLSGGRVHAQARLQRAHTITVVIPLTLPRIRVVRSTGSSFGLCRIKERLLGACWKEIQGWHSSSTP